jgi:HD-like signal output (HDOD) protein
MTNAPQFGDAAAVAKKISIPPRPEALETITLELNKSDPDIDRIVAAIKKDVTLYGAVLRVVNSPVMGLQGGVTSIDRAIMLLGLKKVYSLTQVTAMKMGLSKALKMDRFWDSATEVAEIAAKLAHDVSGVSTESAYSVGMFHDFGIPLMMQAFPDYKTFLQTVNENSLLYLPAEEADRYGFTHYDVGYELGKVWLVPPTLNLAIKLQPQIDALFTDKIAIDELDTIKTLLALLEMAKNISGVYRKFWRMNQAHADAGIDPLLLAHLDLTQAEFFELRDDCLSGLDKS